MRRLSPVLCTCIIVHQRRVIRADISDDMMMSSLSTIQPPYAISKHRWKQVPHGSSYLRPARHSGALSRMHLSPLKMYSSFMGFIFHLFLAQLVIPAYGATSANDLIRTCVNSDNWIRPFWPASIRQYCQGVMNAFEHIEPEVHSISAPAHEFLPVGMAQKPYEGRILEPVRTPWKITSGELSSHFLAVVYMEWILISQYSALTLIDVPGPCTLAVTPVNRSDSEFLPMGIPAPPYPTSGVYTWRTIYNSAVRLRELCLEVSRQPEAGIVWLDSLNTLPHNWNIFGTDQR